MGIEKKVVKKTRVPWNKGKKWSREVKDKIGVANTGKTQLKGIKSTFWKGKDASYTSIHNWIRRTWGQPQFCEFCGITKAKKLKYTPDEERKKDYFHWAMKHGTNSRERSDWFRLCISCHKKYDNSVLSLKK